MVPESVPDGLEPHQGELVIVTGMTGAGRSTAAKELEDLGYFVVDNLPPELVGDVVRLVDEKQGVRQPVAAVVDKAGTFVTWEGRVRPFDQVLHVPSSLPDLRVLAGIADEMGVELGFRTVGQVWSEMTGIGPISVSPSIIDPQQAVTEIGDCDFHPPKVEPAKADAAPAQPATAPAAAQPAEAPPPK